VRALLAVSPESLARAEDVQFDPMLLAFAIGLTLVTGLVFGAAPAVRATRVDPSESLHEGARGNTGGRGSRRARSILVGSQVAVALVLLIGAGTLIRAFVALQRTPLGFDSSGVTTFEVNTLAGDSAERRVLFHGVFAERLRALPGITAVGMTSWLPANGNYHHWGYEFIDSRGERHGLQAQVRVIDGDRWRGIPLVGGGRSGRRNSSPDAALHCCARRAFGARTHWGGCSEPRTQLHGDWRGGDTVANGESCRRCTSATTSSPMTATGPTYAVRERRRRP
jgi:hypothetical protein